MSTTCPEGFRESSPRERSSKKSYNTIPFGGFPTFSEAGYFIQNQKFFFRKSRIIEKIVL
jgi:hypothetical protein